MNPRTTGYQYVNYSFPSKIVEYLASGKPLIAHHIPSVPKEYDEYIFYPKDESDQELKNKIVEVCHIPADELKVRGKQAQQFIMQNKTPVAMGKKVAEFLLNHGG